MLLRLFGTFAGVVAEMRVPLPDETFDWRGEPLIGGLPLPGENFI
jgi:hypothetical protein